MPSWILNVVREIMTPFIYEGEVDYALSNDYEITDWATGNMDWEDVSAYAIQLEVQPPKPNYNKDWANSPKSIKEMEL